MRLIALAMAVAAGTMTAIAFEQPLALVKSVEQTTVQGITDVRTNGVSVVSNKVANLDGLASMTWVRGLGYITAESDPIWAVEKSGYQTVITDYTTTGAVRSIVTGYGYIPSESDPVWNAVKSNYQTVISDLSTIRSGAAAGATAYQKPSGGIPKSDLASAVQTSLGLADSALQSESDPIWVAEKGTYLTTAVASQTYQPKGDYVTKSVTNGLASLTYVNAYTNQAPDYANVSSRAVNAVPYIDDINGAKTAVTIGSRGSSQSLVGQFSLAQGVSLLAKGNYSHAEGYSTRAFGNYSHAEGDHTSAIGSFSHAEGTYSKTEDAYSYAWQGVNTTTYYESHGTGTFNINPVGGLSGFYIGATNLADHISALIPSAPLAEQTWSVNGASVTVNASTAVTITAPVQSDWNATDSSSLAYIANKPTIPIISATDTTFSNAVLAVGLNIDTNSVAVLNEIASSFGGFPIAGTATTVGGLLAALAAAIAWLKKNKANISDLPYGYVSIEHTGSVITAQDGKINRVYSTGYTYLTSNPSVLLPVPASGKITDLILRFNTGTTAYSPSISLASGTAQSFSISGDTVEASGSYEMMCNVVPTDTSGTYEVITTTRNLS